MDAAMIWFILALTFAILWAVLNALDPYYWV